MAEGSYTIKDEAGIHARPAGMLVKAMGGFESEVTISCGTKSANCKRLFAVMGLAVKCGETIRISAVGPDAREAVETAMAFLQENL